MWLVMIAVPGTMKTRELGRYRSRAEAEHCAERLRRFINRSGIFTMFESQKEEEQEWNCHATKR